MLSRVGFLCLTSVLVASVFLSAGSATDPPSNKIRIGTYESRAIAIAYTPSQFNPAKEKMADYQKAKTADDKAKMEILKTWGEQHQRQLHLQGFGRVPVDDLLAPVKNQVAALARERRLAAITMACEFTSIDVELVDVTDDLVKLYDPSEKTLEFVRTARKVKPTPLSQIDSQRVMPAKK